MSTYKWNFHWKAYENLLSSHCPTTLIIRRAVCVHRLKFSSPDNCFNENMKRNISLHASWSHLYAAASCTLLGRYHSSRRRRIRSFCLTARLETTALPDAKHGTSAVVSRLISITDWQQRSSWAETRRVRRVWVRNPQNKSLILPIKSSERTMRTPLILQKWGSHSGFCSSCSVS